MKKTMFFVALATAMGFNTAQAVDWNWEGDIRYRYESSFTNDNVTTNEDHTRDRQRMRVRFGVYPWINEELSAGLQLSTGGTEATSRNETFDDLFIADSVYFNEAFIDYHPMFLNGDVNVILGKRDVAKTLIYMKDLVWDSDLTFEGATLQYGKDSDGKEKDGLSAVAGYYAIDENNAETTTAGQDPYLVVAQAAYKGEISDYKYMLGAGWYNWMHVNKLVTTDSTKPTAANFTGRGFNNIEFFGSFGGSLTETLPWKLYGQYAFNNEEHKSFANIQDDARDAYLVGLQVGNAKAPGQWALSGEYVVIEEDAVAPITDSDRNGSSLTNLKGFKVNATYHLVQNMTIGATYMNFADEDPSLMAVADRDDREHLVQIDAVVKF
jgi:hypothetical protein